MVCHRLAAVSVLYFGGGGLLNRNKNPADGFRIPHEDFWLSLPDLCKDGYYYVVQESQGLSVDSQEKLHGGNL